MVNSLIKSQGVRKKYGTLLIDFTTPIVLIGWSSERSRQFLIIIKLYASGLVAKIKFCLCLAFLSNILQT